MLLTLITSGFTHILHETGAQYRGSSFGPGGLRNLSEIRRKEGGVFTMAKVGTKVPEKMASNNINLSGELTFSPRSLRYQKVTSWINCRTCEDGVCAQQEAICPIS
jgi:hypothetical protein